MIPQLPLLRRELTELSNRRRTYIIRIFGAVGLLFAVYVMFQRSVAMNLATVNPTAGPYRFLGIGGPIFSDIVPLLFRTIQLLMPALCCSAVTIEKERNTIGTLFLTRLSPLTIVLEKLGSRMIPMFTLLLLTFPVLAYVYSLGGVDTQMLLGTLWLLFCETLLYASISLACSVWFQTTVSAFMASYILVALLLTSSGALGILTLTPYDVWLSVFYVSPNVGRMPTIDILQRLIQSYGASTVLLIVVILFASAPSLIMSTCCLVFSRVFLVRRAFVTPANRLMKMFRALDRFFVALNERTTRGVELVKDSNEMPEFNPIAWRERTRKSLGKARYLFRILTALEVPTIFICGLAAISSSSTSFTGLRFLLGLLWGLSFLIISVRASTAISSERARETVEALLSTPLTGAQILKEKIDGMSRLMLVLMVPLITIHFTLLFVYVDITQIFRNGVDFRALFLIVTYMTFAVVGTMLTMRIIAWTSIGIGVRSASQTRSVLAAVVLNVLWSLVPSGLLLFMIITGIQMSLLASQYGPGYLSSDEMHFTIADVLVLLSLMFSPEGPLVLNENYLLTASGMRYGGEFLSRYSETVRNLLPVIVFCSLLLHGVILFLVRTIVLSSAPALLKRLDQAPNRTGIQDAIQMASLQAVRT